MATKHVTDHHDGGDHTRTIVYRNDEDEVTKVVEQKVVDTPIGELGATNTSETTFDSNGNSHTTRK